MTVHHFANMVLGDFLHESDARAGERHAHCVCRHRTADAGLCCFCGRWVHAVEVD